ncbi:glycosyltransferase family 9 protein [Streptacidiphilus monticola]|uniref:Glycosyltransferase family 9 protein n=1 Tax=Streptacidiphilus monticola TaxID=2161674 RepID=A0ABW1FZQ5_9ACTN
MTERQSVVVLRALGLGDLLTGLPALRAVRWWWPAHELVLIAPERLREAARATGCVDRLLPAHAAGRGVPEPPPWTGPPPVAAIDLHGSGPESRRVLEPLRPARLLAFSAVDGPTWREDEHERERWCRLLGWYGIPADPGQTRLDPPARPSPAPGAVLLHPGADAGARRWPPERWAALAAGLRDRGVSVALSAGAGEWQLADGIRQSAGLPPDAVCGGRADVPFDALAALVAGARAVVSGDTGLAHLAVALGTPSVTLFGPVSPSIWGPPPCSRHLALWRPDPGDAGPRPGDAHGRDPDPRLLRITVAEVHDALDSLDVLDALPRPVAAP